MHLVKLITEPRTVYRTDFGLSSYSVQSNVSSFNRGAGGYTVTVDLTNVAYRAESHGSDNSQTNVTASGSHLFFTSKITLVLTTSADPSGYNTTATGSIKYILGS
jgi:hypothetical protein